MHIRPPSIDAGGVPEKDSAYAIRCVPVRIYLPDGPFIQELVPPLLEDGMYMHQSLGHCISLSLHFQVVHIHFTISYPTTCHYCSRLVQTLLCRLESIPKLNSLEILPTHWSKVLSLHQKLKFPG